MELFDQEKNAAVENFFAAYIRKNSVAYMLVLSIVLLFETFMIARSLLVTDLTLLRSRVYFGAYIFLFCITLAGLVVTVLSRNGRVSETCVTLVLHLYCTGIIIWSLLISYLDMVAGNTPIVYLTVIMSIGGLSVVHPLYYAVNLFFSLFMLLTFRNYGNLPYFTPGKDGIYVNLTVFTIISLILDARHYQISRRELELSQYLEKLSYRDQLTGISNRRMYDSAMRQLDEKDLNAMIGILDLDAFKSINDTWGHDFGDACLCTLAGLLTDQFGEGAYRIGGDEFAVICPPVPHDELERRIDEINRHLHALYPGRDVSISAGFCPRPGGEARDAASAAKAADKALYAAKNGGRNRCCFSEE